MKDLYLNSSFDVFLDGVGRLVTVDGAEAVAQAVKVSLLTGLGSYQFDTSFGIDWTGSIEAIRADIVSTLLSLDGVLSIKDIRFAQVGRTLTATVEVITPYSSIPVVVTA